MRIIFLLMILGSCTAKDVHKFPDSMKGYELYSWEQDGEWNFTLMTGTNRNKTYEEIVSPGNVETDNVVKVQVKGVRALKVLFNRIPSGQIISWVGNTVRVEGFTLPPDTVIREIEEHTQALNITLQVVR